MSETADAPLSSAVYAFPLLLAIVLAAIGSRSAFCSAG
jgi:hypothetical protein